MTTAMLAPPASASVAVEPPHNKAADAAEPIVAAPPPACDEADAAPASNNARDESVVTPPQAPSARLKRSASTPIKADRVAKKNKKRRRVSFESAEIFEFEPTIFTTSVTSGGIPVGMSLQERTRSRRRLDSWEMEREDIRVGRQSYMEEGYLDPTERELILNNAGCAEHSMLSVEAEVNQIIAHRRESNEADFEFMYGLAAIGEDEEEDQEEEEEEDDEEEEEEEGDSIEEVQLMGDGLTAEPIAR